MRRILMGLLLICGTATMALAQRVEQGVIVTGQGHVEVAPDHAVLSIGVQQRAATGTEAMQAVTEVMQNVISLLRKQGGIAMKDMQTSQLSLSPVFDDYSNSDGTAPKVIAYEARNTLTVRIRSLTSIGSVIDKALAEKANTFNGLQFALEDESGARATARDLAVKDAMTRATQLAKAAGIRLGGVLRMSETMQGGAPMMSEMSMRSAAGPAVASGTLRVGVEVTMVFDIAPGP